MPHVYEHKLEELLVGQERESVITRYEYTDNY